MFVQSIERGGFCVNARAACATTLLLAAIALPSMRAAVAEDITLPNGLEAGESVTVKAALDGDALALADGRRVRLLGIAAPEPPLDAQAGRNWPLAERATRALVELAQGRRLTLAYDGPHQDRYGDIAAQLYRDDGLWLQGELLARGLARVVGAPGNHGVAVAMLAKETAARNAKRGIWAYRSYFVLAPSDARHHLDSFALVEGKVEDVTRTSGRTEVRLGASRKDGFTAILMPENHRFFTAAKITAKSFEGQRIRVRGFLRWWDGAVIEVAYPEQIEFLDR